MKKHYGILVLLCACLICLAFLGGLYLGRNLTGSGILVSASPAVTQSATPESTATSLRATEASNLPSKPIDINSASLSELQTLPGIGPVLAQRILDYREENGYYASVADLVNVNGIGVKRLEGILDFITVGG